MMNTNTMLINGLSCVLNMPVALKQRYGRDGQEMYQGLPPYAPQRAYSVLEYDEHCPPGWMRGSVNENSYFVAVKEGHGLWLDFNGNRNHSHYVAVRISVQGVCPIAGMKTDHLRLEQYLEKCPKHGVPFEAERFCPHPECGYKWPKQNYLASNATPDGYLWLDGFRSEDGVIRQYVFTTDASRGVAAQIIGDERVYAIGVGFYLSKEPKPKTSAYQGIRHPYLGSHLDLGETLYSFGPTRGGGMMKSLSAPSFEVAAGAKVRQRIYPDPEDLSFWQDEPAGILYVNYVDEETAREILSHGPRDVTAGGEGFMKDLLVGDIPGNKEIQ